ncbi:hypothetical protein [Paenibacillus sp. NPDC058177]|uniref:hypothetical protein n=1 Tax=Paenibacillus sp. NPDC058177 TaxID=3346369 RepID=UPI0036DB8F11
MSNYFVKVKKVPYRSGDHIAFRVYKEEVRIIGGARCPHLTVEHYERFAFDESSKVGFSTIILSKNETDRDKFFDLGDHYTVGQLTDLAEEIQVNYKSYEEQYHAFVSSLVEHGFQEILEQ